MSTAAIVTMIVIAGFVWGGFILILIAAFRKERAKDADTPTQPASAAGGG